MTVRVGEEVDVLFARTFVHEASLAKRLWSLQRVLQDTRVRFVLTGAVNTAVGYGCFVAVQVLVGVHIGYMWSLLLTHVITVLFAFLTHRRLVFRVTGSVVRDLWRFESVYLLGLSVNALVLPLAVEGAGLPVLIAQACITAVNAVVSWLGHSRFTFQRVGVSA